MFEDYLEDAYYFAVQGAEAEDERASMRYYRASVFYTVGAVEAFVNYISDSLSQTVHDLQPYELAFLNDKKFELHKGTFRSGRSEFHSVEEKLRLLICKNIRISISTIRPHGREYCTSRSSETASLILGKNTTIYRLTSTDTR